MAISKMDKRVLLGGIFTIAVIITVSWVQAGDYLSASLRPGLSGSGFDGSCAYDACLKSNGGVLCTAPTRLVECSDPLCNTGPCTHGKTEPVDCQPISCSNGTVVPTCTSSGIPLISVAPACTGHGQECPAYPTCLKAFTPEGCICSASGTLPSGCVNKPPSCPGGVEATITGQDRSYPPSCTYECPADPNTPTSTLPVEVDSQALSDCPAGQALACPDCAEGTPKEACACKCYDLQNSGVVPTENTDPPAQVPELIGPPAEINSAIECPQGHKLVTPKCENGIDCSQYSYCRPSLLKRILGFFSSPFSLFR